MSTVYSLSEFKFITARKLCHFTRDGLGNLTGVTYMKRTGGTDASPVVKLAERREYTAGGHVISNGSLVMSRFGGGYFDASGNPHYYVTDWQGNNVGVVDRNGKLEQRTDYYPYGEPWLEPEATLSSGGTGGIIVLPVLSTLSDEAEQDAGVSTAAVSTPGSDTSVNCYLFADKERTRAGGLNDYRFPARDYVPGFPRFTTVDPLCELRPHQSPYLYCGGNPIMNTDPSGMLWADEQKAQKLRELISNRIAELKQDIDKINRKIQQKKEDGKKYEKEMKRNDELESMIGQLDKSMEDIDVLGADKERMYSFERVSGGVHNVRLARDGQIKIQTSSHAYSIHEIRHIRQGLDVNNLIFNKNGKMVNPGTYTPNVNPYEQSGYNEVEAYRAQFSYDNKSVTGAYGIFDIDIDFVINIQYDGAYGYPLIRDYFKRMRK